MPNRFLISALLVFISLLGLAVSAFATPAKVSGSLEWRYGEHTATQNGADVLNASHFTQKYSFLVEKKGLLSNGRLGKYDLALGYEWSWVDAERGNGQDINIDNPLDKVLYNGELKLAPGGLPFNMRLFSYDLRSTSFVEEDLGKIFSRRGFAVPGETVTNIQNGTNRVTGLTLRAGVKNGHFEGKYRDILSSVPRLLLDFRQTDVKDIKSLNPRDYTDRNLAFVSLNKKDNWFHYKVYTHEDHLDSSMNYREQTFLLGSIDHLERRRWINLTNWIRVSADMSYSETLPSTSSSNLQFQKRYDINLFGKAQRTRWQGTSFTSFSRIDDGDSLARNLSVPLYASGELNRDTSWRASFVGTRTENDLFSGGFDQQTDDLYVTARVDTFRQSRFMFSPFAAAESKQGIDGEGHAVRTGAEFRSNPNYRSDFNIFGQYVLRWFNGTAEVGRDVDFLEQYVEGRFERDVNSQLRVGVKQSFLLADGTYDSTVADNIFADSDVIINHTVGSEGTVFRSLSALSVEHRSVNRVKNRLEFILDYQSSPDLGGSQFQIQHYLDYREKAWSVTVDNLIGFGDELATTAVSLGSGVENFFSNTTRVSYRPSRSLKAALEVGYDHREYSNSSKTDRYRARQSSEYSLWKINGLVRRLASFGQEVELVKSLQDSATVGDNFSAFTLFTHYYPTRISLLSAKLRYEFDSTDENGTLIAFLSAGLDFQKLKVSLDYSYGDREAGLSEAQRTEQRWELRVKKLF